ncbi:MAG: hypothetical protein HC888_05120 [Candidatus Competibacteraceae bacterium]|nr:hypothetical protein [Candidatus Competibacteraceae bacterium]
MSPFPHAKWSCVEQNGLEGTPHAYLQLKKDDRVVFQRRLGLTPERDRTARSDFAEIVQIAEDKATLENRLVNAVVWSIQHGTDPAIRDILAGRLVVPSAGIAPGVEEQVDSLLDYISGTD